MPFYLFGALLPFSYLLAIKICKTMFEHKPKFTQHYNNCLSLIHSNTACSMKIVETNTASEEEKQNYTVNPISCFRFADRIDGWLTQ